MIIFQWVLFSFFIGFLIIVFIELGKFLFKRRLNIIDAENNNEIATKTLVDDLNKVKKEIDIVTGFANPIFYSQREILKSLEKVAQNGKTINIISGKPRGRDNPLVRLAKDYPKVNFYEINTKYLKPHFRITNNSDVFIEREHSEKGEKRFYCYFHNDRFLARKYKEKVNSLIKSSRME